eukprot:226111-Chlamydomonas_euryale.AAC.1
MACCSALSTTASPARRNALHGMPLCPVHTGLFRPSERSAWHVAPGLMPAPRRRQSGRPSRA